MARWLMLALVGALTLSVVLSVAAQDSSTANVQLRVWQSTADPLNVYVSARHEAGRWDAIGTFQLPLDDENDPGTYRYGDVTLPITLPESSVVGDGPTLTAVARGPALTLQSCRSFASAEQDVSMDAPCLLVVSDGSHDTLTLEWVGGSPTSAGWQYRQRRWENFEPLPWGAWTGIPQGCATTRACRLAGLPEGAALDFQVRAVGGPPSPVAQGDIPLQGNLPWVSSSQVAEGDGTTAWIVSEFTITIPAGVRLGDGGYFTNGCEADVEECISTGVQINHLPTGSSLSFSRDGARASRYIHPDTGDQADAINAIFDEIVASVRGLALE